MNCKIFLCKDYIYSGDCEGNMKNVVNDCFWNGPVDSGYCACYIDATECE
jgi:hypothetical protein